MISKLTMVEEASYETPNEQFDGNLDLLWHRSFRRDRPALYSLRFRKRIISTGIRNWWKQHFPGSMVQTKCRWQKGGCRWPECSVFVSGRYAALHVGPVAHLPLGYRTAGKEITAISTKAHKQSLRMRAENPYGLVYQHRRNHHRHRKRTKLMAPTTN